MSAGVTARLVWAPNNDGRSIGGAWWPHTLDAVTELAELLPQVSDHLGGPVKRVSASIDAWDPRQPRRLRVGDAVVRLGWFHTIDPGTVTIGRSNADRVTVLVIPPGLDAAEAKSLLSRLSAATTWPDTAASALNGAWTGEGTGDSS